jgi:hypothetical protein
MVAGYSAGVSLSEEWIINIKNGECKEFKLIRKKEETGVTWNGLVEPIFRLIFGFSPDLTEILKEAELDDKIIKKIINLCQKKLTATMVIPSMPIQDAIDLAAFLVETTINFSKFTPGLTAVGGPIEIAVITRHEGFKWIKRKYYFDVNLNPKEE